MLPAALLLSMATSVLPNHAGTLRGPALQYVSVQCQPAALRVGDAGAAALELRGRAAKGAGAAQQLPAPSVDQVVEWQIGSAPGRYVALLDAGRAGRRVRLRAVVDLRGKTCRLVTWRVTDGR